MVKETEIPTEANMEFKEVTFEAPSLTEDADWTSGTYTIPAMVNTRALKVGEELRFRPYSPREKYQADEPPSNKRRKT